MLCIANADTVTRRVEGLQVIWGWWIMHTSTLRTQQGHLVPLPFNFCCVGLDNSSWALDKDSASLHHGTVWSASGTPQTFITLPQQADAVAVRSLWALKHWHCGMEDVWHPELIVWGVVSQWRMSEYLPSKTHNKLHQLITYVQAASAPHCGLVTALLWTTPVAFQFLAAHQLRVWRKELLLAV